MWNEILQWVLLGMLVVLVTAMYWSYGTAVLRVNGTITETSGPRIGRTLPSEILNIRHDSTIPAVVVFVSENCQTCSRLLADIENERHPSKRNLVLVAAAASTAFADALRETDHPVYFDDGTLWSRLEIQATPFLVYIDERGRVVAKDLGHAITDPAGR